MKNIKFKLAKKLMILTIMLASFTLFGATNKVKAGNCYDDCADGYYSCTWTLSCQLLGWCEHCETELESCMGYCDLELPLNN